MLRRNLKHIECLHVKCFRVWKRLKVVHNSVEAGFLKVKQLSGLGQGNVKAEAALQRARSSRMSPGETIRGARPHPPLDTHISLQAVRFIYYVQPLTPTIMAAGFSIFNFPLRSSRWHLNGPPNWPRVLDSLWTTHSSKQLFFWFHPTI